MAKTVRLADIATSLGVSMVTVSRALNGKSGVSDEMREKIKELSREMGYRPASWSKSLRPAGSTGHIGIVIPNHFLELGSASFYWEMYQRVLTYLQNQHCYGLLEVLKDADERNLVLPRMLQDCKVDGLILIGQLKESYLEVLYETEIPLMFLDSYNGRSGKSSIISDGYYGMYAIVSYLLNMGYKDIHFVGSIGATSSISDRYFGYCRAMNEHKIPVTERMVVPDRDKDGNIHIALPEQLPSAYACNCDLVAYQVIGLLKERGVQVPDDISIVGFDDFIRIPNQDTPQITTYAVDIDAMASSAVNDIIQKIRDKNYRPCLKVITGHLEIKDTVNPLS
ncbi:MAG: substrate-binding domain-containing protein [Oscillospiraceae bacterium]|nr:substrate-binding domain-containing protein [Oscillospiraceae bacterium]